MFIYFEIFNLNVQLGQYFKFTGLVMGGLDLNTNEATKDNTLFVPGQACSKWLAPTPNATILGCQACLNQKIYLFYNDNRTVWGWNYDPTTDSWSDRITTSKFDHFQQPCATLLLVLQQKSPRILQSSF